MPTNHLDRKCKQKVVVEGAKIYHKLLGNISFLNHACNKHYNTQPVLPNDELGLKCWKHASAFKKIFKGQEITVSYDCNFPKMCPCRHPNC